MALILSSKGFPKKPGDSDYLFWQWFLKKDQERIDEHIKKQGDPAEWDNTLVAIMNELGESETELKRATEEYSKADEQSTKKQLNDKVIAAKVRYNKANRKFRDHVLLRD